MKGRGTRTVNKTDLRTVTPDAPFKNRFVIIDAVGVTESKKTDSRPLERKPSVPLKNLLNDVAVGNRDTDILISLANRLARLNNVIENEDKDFLYIPVFRTPKYSHKCPKITSLDSFIIYQNIFPY